MLLMDGGARVQIQERESCSTKEYKLKPGVCHKSHKFQKSRVIHASVNTLANN
jgi:hypothetical protein